MEMKVKKIHPAAKLPTYGTAESAGADLYVLLNKSKELKPGETFLFHTGICLEMPKGYVGLVYARSGTALKKGLAPANKVGVIDSDYRGEIMVALHNHSDRFAIIEPGERIAQIIFTTYQNFTFEEVEELSTTDRGNGGYGSTGTK